MYLKLHQLLLSSSGMLFTTKLDPADFIEFWVVITFKMTGLELVAYENILIGSKFQMLSLSAIMKVYD